MPSSSYPIAGQVKDTNGTTNLVGCIVTAKNIRTNEFMPYNLASITVSDGSYTLDLANFTSGYQRLDTIRIYAFKPPNKYYVYEHVVDDSNALDLDFTIKAVSYCTPQDVADLIQYKGWQVNGQPNICTICSWIAEAEDEIDFRTNHSWRTRYSGTTTGAVAAANYEYHDLTFPYEYLTGRPIYLGHRMVKTLSTGAGDVIEMWDGADWTNWTTTMTEGRNCDYWLDYDQGILYIKSQVLANVRKRLRIKYRYGDPNVNGDIKSICIKMVAIKILMSDDRSVIVPGGMSQSMSLESRINMWKEEIEYKIDKYKEWVQMKSIW